MLTLVIVSLTDGKGSLGRDPWKLYSLGLFQPDRTLTTLTHSIVLNEILAPGARDSYIQPYKDTINTNILNLKMVSDIKF